MKTTLAAASFAILSALALTVSCNKNNPDPDPTPVETYTVNAYYDFKSHHESALDPNKTVSKMLDFYQEKGFIDSHFGLVSSVSPIILQKTGVEVADTAKVLASLRKELKEKLTLAAKEIRNNDWSKTFGVDSFRLGYISLCAVTETGEEIDATSFCMIPFPEFGKEYVADDATQQLQKFTVREELYKPDSLGVPIYRAAVRI